MDFPMDVIIETERLYMRLFEDSDTDVALIFGLNSDPEVIRYTHDPIRDRSHAREILQQVILPQYTLYRHGRWAVHLRSDLSFLGWCGLKYRPEVDEVDLGYRFTQAAWGRGYATESAAAAIRYGFEKLGLERITGHAMPANTASCKVMEKCGMAYRGLETVDGELVHTYDLLNPGTHS